MSKGLGFRVSLACIWTIYIHPTKNRTLIHRNSLLFMDAGTDPSDFGSKFVQTGGIYASRTPMWTPLKNDL